MLVDLAAVAALPQAVGPDPRMLPLPGLVDGHHAVIAPGKDQEPVGLVEGMLVAAVHGVVEGDHLHDVVPLPGLVPAAAVAGAAAESLRLLANRSSFRDPGTGAKLDPLALYLSMLFEWQGWDHPDRDRLLVQTNGVPQYFRFHDADKWDDAPLLRVDRLELRQFLGLAAKETHISPAELTRTNIEDPQTRRNLPFGLWGEQLARKEALGDALSAIESGALELANRLWLYEKLRMGGRAD